MKLSREDKKTINDLNIALSYSMKHTNREVLAVLPSYSKAMKADGQHLVYYRETVPVCHIPNNEESVYFTHPDRVEADGTTSYETKFLIIVAALITIGGLIAMFN